jgi:signal transduction histidine kinase
VPDAYRVAPPLVAARIDREWIERLAAKAGPATGAAVAWVSASLNAQGLAAELCESTDRMSTLVKAVKAYAYMDRGEVVEADVHEGLKTTMMVLGHKLKHTSIQVEKHLDKSLPKIMIRGGELNQVWTNLIANAIEALGDSGTITISTQLDGPCIRVDIADDGPGIPPENLDRIFDPFFTTKVVGQGTGLGLDTARRIVEERHKGTLSVESEPGNTVFHVWLPLNEKK